MDSGRFDTLTQSLSEDHPRRGLLRGLVRAALGLAALQLPGVVDAKKRRKKKRRARAPQLNAYGCLDVGKACGGNDALCCSGICEGTKPKKGKNDTSRCVGHNAGICTRDTCAFGVGARCDVDNPNCLCLATTGKANFCSDISRQECRVCQRDTDCETDFGVGAACVVLGDFCAHNCATTGGTACFAPCACVPDCTGQECGDNGCGGSCGSCPPPETCDGGTCCLPDCNGKDCGSDGCGGSCGPCDGGSCQDGVCACPADKCFSICVAACPGTMVRVPFPDVCSCCWPHGTSFPEPGPCGDCCAGSCPGGGPPWVCVGRSSGAGCQFDAQCASNDCQDTGSGAGTCA